MLKNLYYNKINYRLHIFVLLGGESLKHYITQLQETILFSGLDQKTISSIFEKISYKISEYKKDELIAIEGDNCHSLGIILEGTIEVQKVFPSGQVTTINNFKTGNIFGEALIFSDHHKYPATITNIIASKIMYIEKVDIVNLLILHPKLLNNFMSILSNRVIMLNQRISHLSQDTLRKKISHFLLDENEKQKTKTLIFNYTRKKMAELLNIPRPSLSRELTNMKKEGVIEFHQNTIQILKIELLEEALFKE